MAPMMRPLLLALLFAFAVGFILAALYGCTASGHWHLEGKGHLAPQPYPYGSGVVPEQPLPQ